ncbi:unnamed protein product [Diplocarpon coronariae]|uniref:Tyrosinase copper-binding domain-containing protein n=1 Tax=Diplocarpon coronariae TaxID=2795749 RepID=A0A218ZG40_9HELO|nr:hypothetical protein B2J93_7810 [Marssonina coronariae]
MRISLLLLAASVASAGTLRQRADPASQFSSFHLLSISDARDRKDLDGKNFEQPNSVTSGLSNAAAIDTPQSRACRASPNVRYEWRDYSQSDRLALMKAIKCLLDTPPSGNFPPSANRYEDYARLHQLYTPNVHGNSKFLVWHRVFLFHFEQELRRTCRFDRAFVWWDETKDAGAFAKSDLFTQPYYGNLLPPQANGQGWCINSGAFGGITINIGPGNTNTPHCLTRAVNEQLTAECNAGYVQLCNGRGTYAEYLSCINGGPHAYGHNGIGAVMSDMSSSPSDPIFYQHHAFVDRCFRVWQNADPERTVTINGNDAFGTPVTMDTGLFFGGLAPDVKVSDVMDTLSGTVIGGVPFCYRYNY